MEQAGIDGVLSIFVRGVGKDMRAGLDVFVLCTIALSRSV